MTRTSTTAKARAPLKVRVLPVVDVPYNPREHGARCDICPLKGNTVVPPKAAPLPPKVVFVGEAPGRKEELQGVPFVGQTGVFLRGLCREVDIDFREAALTNAALCRSNIDKENDEAAVCCAPRLLKELAQFDPKIPIVTFGKSSTLSVLGVRSIMHSRGFVWTAREVDALSAWKAAKKAKERGAPKAKELRLKAQIYAGRAALAGRTILPTVHPAFVLRSDTWLPILKIDLDRIARWLRGELTHEKLVDNGPYVVVTKKKDVIRALNELDDDFDVDIETGASGPGADDGANPMRNKILCVGASDGDHTLVIWPWVRKVHAPLLNARFKRARSIGMHNGYNFDQIVLDREDVPFEPIEEKLQDTLIAHHTFASHMPQRLSHVASVFVDVGPWKITFKRGKDGASEKGLPPEKLDPKDLVKYNAADARVQARVRRAMRADLESELDVYAVDLENARLCRSMIIGGIGVDLERRDQLREAMIVKETELLAKMRKLLRRANFHPMQLVEVRKALFTTLRAPLSAADPTESGLPSTSQKTLERLKENPTRAGRFADYLLQWRGVVKIRGTYCNPPEAPIWLHDGSFKQIGDVCVGDIVVGWRREPDRGQKSWLVPARVTAVQRRVAPIVRLVLASGRVIRCTEDHLWLKGVPQQRGNESGPWYNARVGRKLAHIVDVPRDLPHDLALKARWLGGMFDGEGSCPIRGPHRKVLTIAQSPTHNPAVCSALTDVLTELGLHFNYYYREGNNAAHFRITKRQTIVNFLHWCQPVLREKAARALSNWAALYTAPDEIVSITPDGVGDVVGLTTETGNYVVWGYASKNCDSQVLDRPSKKWRAISRTHFNWRSYGAASGRYSCRLQSCPRAEYLKDKSIVLETRMREVYVARPGCKLAYFDLSQAELRFAAYLSGDRRFIEACESGDVHTATAKQLFPAEAELIGADPKGAGKPFRDVEKNSIFGFIYFADPQTIFTFVRAKGLPVEMRDVLRMHDMVHETFADYFRYVEHNKRWVDKNGYLRDALSGRISWLGWNAGYPDVANRPIQGGIASLMNVRLPRIWHRLPAGSLVVAQVHDAAIMEIPEKHVDRVRALVKEVWDEPVVIPANGFGSSLRVEDGARSFVMPIDLKVGERWSDFG